MKYEFNCDRCGAKVIYETDMKPPLSVKCPTRGCGKIFRDDLKK